MGATTKGGVVMDEMIYTHPSYGQLEVTRCSSSSAHPLYGSSIKHRETLRIRLYSSSAKRSLSNNWYHPGRTMFNLAFVKDQFTEQMDKTVLSAKGEIEAYQQARMSEIALRIMALQQKTDLEPGLPPLDVGDVCGNETSTIDSKD